MAKARVNTEDVTSFKDTIQRERENLDRICDEFSAKLNEISDKVQSEKKKFNDILEKCASAIAKVSAKIEDINVQLEQLRAQLAATSPTITVTSTDEEGNMTEEEVSNPAYEALEQQVSQLESRKAKLEQVLNSFAGLKNRASNQMALLDNVVQKVQEMQDESLRVHYQQLNTYCDEATQKLNDIQQFLQEYEDVKIQTPNAEIYMSSVGGFFDALKDRKMLKKLREPASGSNSVSESLKKCNPKFDGDVYEYSHNCQRCVPTYEMLRRGYSVTAKPIMSDNDYLSKRPYDVWKDPDIIRTSGNGKREIEEAMAIWGDGARAQIVVAWKRDPRYGHTFVAEQENGKTYFYDPQNGREDCSVYFDRVALDSVDFCRIDRLEPSNYIKDCMEEIK